MPSPEVKDSVEDMSGGEESRIVGGVMSSRNIIKIYRFSQTEHIMIMTCAHSFIIKKCRHIASKKESLLQLEGSMTNSP